MSHHQHRSARHRQHSTQHRHRSHDGPRNDRWSDRVDQGRNAHRSRTFDRREFRVADRPHNSYRSGTADRTHNGRRIASAERSDSTPQATSWSYRGSHRSEGSHHNDNDRPAGRPSRDQHRSESGRHHHGHFGDHNGHS